jgi:hypothetical protein
VTYEDVAMHPARTPPRLQASATGRKAAGRRLRAARMLADASVRDVASAAGLTLGHVVGIESGREPVTACQGRLRIDPVAPVEN